MNNNNDSSLMPKPRTAIEKAEPGARRILAGMVAETLALARSEKAKHPFTVLAGEDHFVDLWRVALKSKLGKENEVRFIRFENDAELVRLASEHPFDLVCLYVGNIHWSGFKGPYSDPWFSNDFLLQYIVGTLTRLKIDYGKPIIATQGVDWVARFEGTGVTFLTFPFAIEEFWPVVAASLPEHTKTP